MYKCEFLKKTLLNSEFEFLQYEGAMFLFLTTSRISVGFNNCDVIGQNLKVVAKAVGFCRSLTWVPFKAQKSKEYLT